MADLGSTVESTFRVFCGAKQDMDGKSFAKLCKDGGLIDKHFTATDVDLIFAKVVLKGQRRISLQQFDIALSLVAEKKSIDVDCVCHIVQKLDGPVLRCTKADAVRFHDDRSTYTGTHLHGGSESVADRELASCELEAGSKQQSRGSHTSIRTTRTSSSSLLCEDRFAEVPDSGSPGCRAALQRDRSASSGLLLGKDSAIEAAFQAYCGMRADMEGKSFVKLCRDCGLIDQGLTTSDVDIIFATVLPKGQRRLSLQHFQEALDLLAEKKGVPSDFVISLVAESAGPILNCTKVDAVRFHDDKRMYTGTHANGGPDAGGRETWRSQLRPSTSAFFSMKSKLDELDCSVESGEQWMRRNIDSCTPSDCSGNHIQKSSPRSPQTSEISQALNRCGSHTKFKPLRRPLSTRPRSPMQRATSPPNDVKRRPPVEGNEVTMVFTDVQGSTSLWEANPVAMEQALRLHDASIRQILALHCGYEITTEGDAFQVVFHDAVDAVSFCLRVQSELLECQWPEKLLNLPDASESTDGAWKGLRVRMGVHTGRPIGVTKHEVTGRSRYAGQVVALTKAIEGVCNGGQILVSANCFSHIDGLLIQLGSPQVIDLGIHVLKGSGLLDETMASERCPSTAKVQLLQLVPRRLYHDYFSACDSGRVFPPIASVERIMPGFHESPSGSSITLCFAFAKGAKDLVTSEPLLAEAALGMLRVCVRGTLQDSSSGYECQEDAGDFMLAFADMDDAAAFAVALQRSLARLPWSAKLRACGPMFAEGLRVAVGALSGEYTSRGPHASTGRADYFGSIVNRTARIGAAGHAGQVLLGGERPLSGSTLPNGVTLRRLGSFTLKGIDMPLIINELCIPDSNGVVEVFPEPKTVGRATDTIPTLTTCDLI